MLIEPEIAVQMSAEYRKSLESGTHVVKSLVREPNKTLFVDWTPYLGHTYTDEMDTRFNLKRLQELAKRPRRKFLSPSAKEYGFALYEDSWKQKVERVGTLNYPEAARGKLYGSLLLSVSIRADGSVEKVSVQRSSGHKVLDEAAVRIVKMAAPYAPFPPDIRKDYDIIEITRTWKFERSDRVRAY